MHSHHGALPEPYVPVRVTLGAVIVHRYTYAPPGSRTSHYRMTFIPLSVSLWNNLGDPVFDGVWLMGVNSRANAFSWAQLLPQFMSLTVYLFLVILCVDIVGRGLQTDMLLIVQCSQCTALSLLALPTFFNNNYNNKKLSIISNEF